nr:EOG090X026K [Lepidurus arcticus]
MNDRLVRAERAVEENPYNLEAWSFLIRDAQQRRIEDVRNVYERLVTAFPTSGRYWKIYIEQEMKARNYDRVEKLFPRCLIKVLHIDLWKLYLTYIKEGKASLPNHKEKMAQAYDFALDKIGLDVNSYPIWNDYISFLKGVEAIGSYAENQKISAIRKVYQRGVVTPILSIEQLWKDYLSFEQNINPIIAEKMSLERSRDYMNARRVAKELEAVTRGINRTLPSTPPTGHPEEARQVELWKKYLHWEKSNPLHTEDMGVVIKRVMFAYEQCLLCLGHHPDVWYEAALFLEQSAKVLQEKGDVTGAKACNEDVAAMYERAITGPLKSNQLLYFAYADYEESRLKHEKANQIYSKFIDQPDVDPTLAYVQYMRFARRAEGIKAARSVFKKAREDSRSSHEVYTAAALMEYMCSKDKTIAFKIFELGLKKFSDNADYLSGYVDYLSHLNEDNNTRVLFERILTSTTLAPEHSLQIWDKFLEFESSVGDLNSIVKVEKRRAGVLEKLQEFEGKETALLVDRYKFGNLFPCSAADLRAIGYYDIQKAGDPKEPVVEAVAAPTATFFASDAALPKPDFSQMVPFKPKQQWAPGEHSVPGGMFPMPPATSHLCSILPPPDHFQGPFVRVDDLLDLFIRLTLPDTAVGQPYSENGEGLALFDQVRSVQWGQGDGGDGKRKKRTAAMAVHEESDDEDSQSGPPAKDIYRQRQQKRVK